MDLFGQLRDILEYVLLGAMATAVFLYAFIWFNPLAGLLRDYFTEAGRLLHLPALDLKNRFVQGSVAAVVVGWFFLAGTVTNVVAYWFVEPVHNEDITQFYWSLGLPKQGVPCLSETSCSCTDEKDEPASSILWREVLSKKLWWDRSESACEKQTYAAILRDEASWRTLTHEAAEDELHGIIKQIRLSRGAVVCLWGIILVALVKAVVAIIVWGAAHGPNKRFYEWLYYTFIEPVHQSPTTGEGVRQDTLRKMRAYLLTAFIGACLYLLAFNGWLSAEREFHGLAYFGNRAAQAANDKGSTNISISPGSSHP